ncbi:hypothetical protein OsI_18227 [Oryza sativa Indica Group]|uniref:Uncharacterized protein n=3 Tax=Oryza TaxID=4527 RepID=B9FKD2_ORYSJ|nr:hypothetical protein OsI_18227 [Oryza sativa Indica Group]EEE62125.1 hypothetical protein OsJ_16912 [Oryza sativa Japonica Group]
MCAFPPKRKCSWDQVTFCMVFVYSIWISMPVDQLAPMGFLQNTFSVCVGIGCGIYIAQNYDVPNMKKLMRDWMGKAKEVEESYKKPGGSKN